MSNPLIIYLDSSDYSVLSDESKRTQEIIEIENELIKLREEGKIEIRYSYSHIIEAAPVALENKVDASKRLKKINELCNAKCLVEHLSIIQNEITSLSKAGLPLSSFETFNNYGVWFPDITPDDEFFDIEKLVSELPDRTSKRKAKRNLFNNDGSYKPAYRELLLSATCKQFPLTHRQAKLVIESFIETNSFNAFISAVSLSLSNIDNLILWYEQCWDLMRPLSSYFRSDGAQFKYLIENYKESFIQQITNTEEPNFYTREVKKKCNDLRVSGNNSLAKSLVSTFTLKHLNGISTEPLCNPCWELSPSLLTIEETTIQLLKNHLLAERKLKDSDYVDILHLVYLPYVDVFRADKNTASLIQQAKLPLKTKVVSKLTELPNVINQLLLQTNNLITHVNR